MDFAGVIEFVVSMAEKYDVMGIMDVVLKAVGGLIGDLFK